MPFDPTTYEAPVVNKPDVFSLEGLMAWLEKQNPETTYDWNCCDGGCLIGLYYAAHGIPQEESYAQLFYKDGAWPHGTYAQVCSKLSGPTTFGAALTRARALLAVR